MDLDSALLESVPLARARRRRRRFPPARPTGASPTPPAPAPAARRRPQRWPCRGAQQATAFARCRCEDDVAGAPLAGPEGGGAVAPCGRLRGPNLPRRGPRRLALRGRRSAGGASARRSGAGSPRTTSPHAARLRSRLPPKKGPRTAAKRKCESSRRRSKPRAARGQARRRSERGPLRARARWARASVVGVRAGRDRRGAHALGLTPYARGHVAVAVSAEDDGAVAALALFEAVAEGDEILVGVDHSAFDRPRRLPIVAAVVEGDPAPLVLLARESAATTIDCPSEKPLPRGFQLARRWLSPAPNTPRIYSGTGRGQEWVAQSSHTHAHPSRCSRRGVFRTRGVEHPAFREVN